MERTLLNYLTVVISGQGIAEIDKGSQTLFIPRENIRQMILTTGTGAERPIAQVAAAGIFILIGLFGVVSCVNWINEGGRIFSFHVLLILNIFIGVWLLWTVVRKRVFLLVTTSSGIRKIVFKGAIDMEELSEFLRSAERDLGYSIQSQLPGVFIA